MWLYFLKYWNFITFHTSISPKRSHELLAWVSSFGPHFDLQLRVFFDCQVQDFCRSVRLHYKYANQPDDPDFNPKLYVNSDWNPPREDPNLEESRYNIRQDLLESFNQSKPRWRNNLSSEERSGLREIKEDPTVRVLATVKNLALALISIEWVEKETLKHHNDTKSYSKVTLDDWTFRRHKVIETREKLVQSYPHFLPPNSHKFLRSLDDNPQSLSPSVLYYS